MLFDLSVAVNEQTPVYPGDPEFQAEKTGGFDNEGYEGHVLHMGTHAGTHIDAPSHMIQGGKSLDEYAIQTFTGEAVCVPGFDLEALKSAKIAHGSIVLFYTGASEHYYDPKYFTEYPAMSAEAAEYLVEQHVKLVGLDTCSADNAEGFLVHKTLLGADILIIENLVNLKDLAGRRFKLTALPLKVNLDGAPARVIAEVE